MPRKPKEEDAKFPVVDDVEQPLSPSSAVLDEQEEEQRIRTLLGQGSYHLPPNTHWYPDLVQYTRNNHPLLAVCCQSPLHPISRGMRAVGLLGSVMIGLVLTNVIYMWQLHTQQEQQEEEAILEVSAGGYLIGDDHLAAQYTPSFEVSSTAMIVLWTVGSAIHSIFDSFLWYISSSCGGSSNNNHSNHNNPKGDNNNDKLRKYCNVIIVLMVVLVSTAATLAVVIRAMTEANSNSSATTNATTSSSPAELQQQLLNANATNASSSSLTDKNNYMFLQAYAVELALAWFLWFFVLEAILFSGILSCGQRCLPSLLGGWSYQVQQEREYQQQQEQPKKRHRNSGSSSSSGKKRATPGAASSALKKSKAVSATTSTISSKDAKRASTTTNTKNTKKKKQKKAVSTNSPRKPKGGVTRKSNNQGTKK